MKDYDKFYRELNKKQRAAVDSIDGPLLVLAGPGTGKTQLLSVRAGAILKKISNIHPENILILTYTNSAAKTMKERLAKIIGRGGYDVEVCTFHSFSNSIIQESEEAANYAGEKIPMTDLEQMKTIEHVIDNAKGLEAVRPFRAPYTYAKEMLRKISDLKKDGITPRGLEYYLDSDKADYRYFEDKHKERLRAFSIVYKRYEELKSRGDGKLFDERGRYDFDDMIIYATEALREEEGLRKEYQAQYRYVMVDEFQDTNGAQLELLFTLLDYKNPNLCCVGDDDQSIYRFQGASVGNFKLLKKRFPKMKTMSLDNNYRSSGELIDASSKIISMIPSGERVCEKTLKSMRHWHDKEMIFKEFTTLEEELLYIVEKVRELKDKVEKDGSLTDEERANPYNNIAVLVRKRTDILKIIDAFLQAGIPYATDGKEDISGERRVRQLLDILELAHLNPADEEACDLALYKVLSSDYFEIPQIDMLRFISFVNNKKSRSKDEKVTLLGEFLKYFDKNKDDIKFDDYEKLSKAAYAVRNLLADARTKTLHTMLMSFIKEAGIFKYILKEYDGNNILRIRQLRALGSFINMVKSSDMANPAMRLDDFMDELKTREIHDMPIQGDLVTLTQNGVRVYTAHGSKGLEFHSVIIPFCLQNKSWPARQVAEKIRLPQDLFKTKEHPKDREFLKQLYLQDETRLFYVAMTRARSNLIFTASPEEDAVSSLYLTNLDISRESPDRACEEELIERSLDMTDLQDPFINTEAVLKDMINNMSLNPTRINNYMLCRRKFLYNDVLKIPGAKKISLMFGNCVHKALESVYKEYMKTGRFPSFKYFEDAFRKELKFQGADRQTAADCIKKMGTLKAWFDAVSKKPVMPIDLEKKLLVTIGDNIIFTGKYDKVEWEDETEKTVRIIDYKTGKPDEHIKDIDKTADLASGDCDGYLRQLVCYKLLFEKDRREAMGRRVKCGCLVFIEPLSSALKGYKKDEHVIKKIDISESMVEEMEGIIKDIWGNIQRLQFEKLKKRDEKKCSRCDFDTICWG